MSEVIHKIPITNYSYGYAKSTYEKLEQYEVSMQVPHIGSNESIIVRLDGKGLTSRFKSDTELFLPDFHWRSKPPTGVGENRVSSGDVIWKKDSSVVIIKQVSQTAIKNIGGIKNGHK